MIFAFANKKLEATKEEYEYLVSLQKTFGIDPFLTLFDTDKNGYITSITPSPTQSIQIIILFAILNLMLNQRLRMIDHSKIQELEKKILALEEKIKA